MKPTCPPEQISRIIRYAWEDRTSFEEIKDAKANVSIENNIRVRTTYFIA